MSDPQNARIVFARNMRRERKCLKLSQEALADAAGLHRTYIGHVERAEVNVSIDNMERIAQTLKIPLEQLMMIDPPITPPPPPKPKRKRGRPPRR